MNSDTSVGILQQLGDLLVAMPVVATAIHGWRRGLFATALLGLNILASFFLGFACADQIAPMLSLTLWAAGPAKFESFFLTFLFSLSFGQLALGRFLPEGAMRFSPAIVRATGTVLGLLSGTMLTGVLLIAWSMTLLPPGWKLAGSQLRRDPGSYMLRVLASGFNDAENIQERSLNCYAGNNWQQESAPETQDSEPAVPAGNQSTVPESSSEPSVSGESPSPGPISR